MIFIKAIMLGLFTGFVYDFFRIARRSHPFCKFSTCYLDLLFFSIAAVMMLLFSVAVGNGQLRWFFLIGQAVGGWLYLQTVSALVLPSGCFLVLQTRRILSFATRILLVPSAWLVGLGCRICRPLTNLKFRNGCF